MKSKKLTKLLIGAFALSLSLGGGVVLAKSLKPSTEIVLAEDEEPVEIGETGDEDPVSDGEDPSDDETPVDSGSDTGVDSETSDGSEPIEIALEPEATVEEDVATPLLKAIWQAFVDAIKDLIRHIKSWFGIK